MTIDCNIHWPVQEQDGRPSAQQITALENTLHTLKQLGYTHAVLNYTLKHSQKPPQAVKNPIDLGLLPDSCKDGLKLYTRVTIIIDEPSHGQSISKLSSLFDIIAVLPTSEKALLLACNSLDIDLITFDYSIRLPTFLKHKTIGSAIKRGIKFEITYSNFLVEQNRPIFINNCLNLIRASRNQNIVISSGSNSPIKLRNFNNVLNLLSLLGFKQSSGNKLADNASKVVLAGRLRLHSYKQTVMVGENLDSVELKRNINQVTCGDVFKNQLKKVRR